VSKTMRFQFRKGPEVRFLSHLDLVRAMERAVRRAGLPMAYSEGFSPRPIMSYSFALPVGVLSEAEYADFRLTEELEPAEFMELFNRHLPPGFRVLQAAHLPQGAPSLMSGINAALWKLHLPVAAREEIQERWRRLQAEDSFVVERQTKKGTRQVDLLPLVYGLPAVLETGDAVEVHCLAALGSEANLRVEELALLLGFNPAEALVTRMGQFKKEGSHYRPPLGNRGFTWTES
jgi:radical SAM-linked protein